MSQFLSKIARLRRHPLLLVILLASFGAAFAGLRWQAQVKAFAASMVGEPRADPHAAGGCEHEAEGKQAKGEHDDDHGRAAPDADGHEDEHDHDAPAADAHSSGEEGHDEDGADEDAHDHAAEADHKHDEAAAVKLSTAAQGNVGLRLMKVELRSFERTITVPAMVVERPGRSTIQVAAPLTGVVTRIWPVQGETVAPGQPLFDLRLTHEEVVEAQAEFLRTGEELDVVGREIARLEKVAANGAIAGKTLLERTYEQQKLKAVQHAQRQRLLLHGLSPQQVDGILANRALLSAITVSVPEPAEASATPDAQAPLTPTLSRREREEPVLQVQSVKVDKGQHVKAGDPLCVLADHGELYIQGKAFEQDAPVLDKAVSDDWRVTAVTGANGRDRQTVPNLKILYVANQVEPESRAFLFYVQLPNKVIRTRQTADGHRFSGWQFKPGQRVELLVPVERWTDRIVLPVAAVVQDGAESYVFENNAGHFDRRSVRVEYRDQYSAVIANDGTLTPGKMVIVSGAYLVHLAMKNKAGGAPDPHAGHNH